jgi:hypothetical protein
MSLVVVVDGPVAIWRYRANLKNSSAQADIAAASAAGAPKSVMSFA